MIVKKEIEDEELFFSPAGSDHFCHFVASPIWLYKLPILEVLYLEFFRYPRPGDKTSIG